MNAFSEFAEITICHKMRWNMFPLFLFSRPVCIRWELFFEELLEFAYNIIWTYACFFIPYLFLTSADFLSIMWNWEAHFLKISIYYI